MRQEKLLEEIDDVRNENEALRQARQQLLELQVQAQADERGGRQAAGRGGDSNLPYITPISPRPRRRL